MGCGHLLELPIFHCHSPCDGFRWNVSSIIAIENASFSGEFRISQAIADLRSVTTWGFSPFSAALLTSGVAVSSLFELTQTSRLAERIGLFLYRKSGEKYSDPQVTFRDH
jgi:hypothetical protein